MKGNSKRIFNKGIVDKNTRLTNPSTKSEDQFFVCVPVNVTMPFHEYEKLVALVKKTHLTVNNLVGKLVSNAYDEIGTSSLLPNKNVIIQLDGSKLFDRELLDY